MDNRALLEKLSQSFNRNDLTQFMRTSSGKFRPEKQSYSHFLADANFITDLTQLGRIDFDDGRRLILVAGEVKEELTSHSGKKKQYEVAQRVLANDFDAGIFVFHDSGGHFRFSLISVGYKDGKKILTSFRRYTYFVSPDLSVRTFVEQIGKADFSSIEKITEAFSVEPVTTEFFREYRRIFEEAEATIRLRWDDDKKRLYTQRFFNRMMFIAFLERKGWLKFNGRKDYLKALFKDYYENETDKRTANFHRSRLNNLFFQGLNSAWGNQRNNPKFRELNRRIGDVPYLNGGLFDEEDEDKDGPLFPDTIIAKILNELIYHFNFTVTESTPLDVEVAVDPEMLGRIFEELVTGRHESGSYYTPKPVVAFMCREALRGYLETALPDQPKEVLALFVNENDAAEINNPEAVLNALRMVKVCDPACGSGAYLLGMLHELLEKREVLFAAQKVDSKTSYDRKLEIIQNNLYGVDIDDFAVNIARLRLWLSLVVDDTRNPLEDPKVNVALPNLDFKIETGDSLTAPDPSGGLQPDMFRYGQVQEFLQLKNEFMGIHAGSEKKNQLEKQIKELRTKIEQWAHPKGYDKSSNAFDWQVDFAEVFAPELAQNTLSGKMTGIINSAGGQMEFATPPKASGFDIILANPPYGAMVNENVRDLYFDPRTERGQSKDIYGLFIARGLQLVRKDGQFCFIVSDTWRTIKSHNQLRKRLLETTTILHILDLPSWIFNATVNTCILTLCKRRQSNSHRIIAGELRGIQSGDWRTLAENLNAVANHANDMQTIEYARYTYPQATVAAFRNLSFFVGSPNLYKIMSNKSSLRLEAIADVKVGLQTGDNEYYLRKSETARGGYKILEEENLLRGTELSKLSEHEKENGIDPSRYNGRHFVPYDKGGESDSDEGWLPNYYVPTQYFMDWSRKAIKRLRTATIADVKRRKGNDNKIKPSDESTRAAYIRNPEFYFREGITFSRTGFYSPTFRINSSSAFDTEGSCIFTSWISTKALLAILSSKLIRYIVKCFIDHTVHTQVDDLKDIPLIRPSPNVEADLVRLADSIIQKQHINPRYAYHLYEQNNIDQIVYRLYDLSEDDIREIDLWYCRRYSRLARSQGIWEKVQQKYASPSIK
jgi:type I restriction-modification system DNA methylase subunit